MDTFIKYAIPQNQYLAQGLPGVNTSTANITAASSTGYVGIANGLPSWSYPMSQYPNSDDFVLRLFTLEERKTWLIENGYPEHDEHIFYRAMEERLKAMLLAPKHKLTVKIPSQVGDKI